MDRQDRVVVVAGGGRGIGAAVVKRFVSEGARVAIVDIAINYAELLAQEMCRARPGSAKAVFCDVRSVDDVRRMTDEVHLAFGPVAVLVNGAGSFFKYRMTHETPESEWDSVLDSHLKGAFLCSRAILPDMMAVGQGHIINIASNAARSVSTAHGCEYTAAKSGVLGLTRHMAQEYAAYNILINAVSPGPTAGERVQETASASLLEDIRLKIPLGRLGEPDDAAAVVQFLASPGARFITGATIEVNGGLLMV